MPNKLNMRGDVRMRDLKDVYLELKNLNVIEESVKLGFYECKLLQDALEKLIPVKAMPDKNNLTDKQEYNYWVCPNCNQTFAGMIDYCYHCGQALNWKGSVYDNEFGGL